MKAVDVMTSKTAHSACYLFETALPAANIRRPCRRPWNFFHGNVRVE